MNITDVRVFPVASGGNLKAFASLTFEESFVVRGIKIVEGKNGLFASMPDREWKGNYYDVCFPLTNALREEIQESVLSAFTKTDKKKKTG